MQVDPHPRVCSPCGLGLLLTVAECFPALLPCQRSHPSLSTLLSPRPHATRGKGPRKGLFPAYRTRQPLTSSAGLAESDGVFSNAHRNLKLLTPALEASESDEVLSNAHRNLKLPTSASEASESERKPSRPIWSVSSLSCRRPAFPRARDTCLYSKPPKGLRGVLTNQSLPSARPACVSLPLPTEA